MRFRLKDYLTERERGGLFLFCALVFGGLLAGQFIGPAVSGRGETMPAERLATVAAQDTPLQVDIRTAGAQDLELLPGIGPKRAQDIIAYRQQHGFASPRDLLEVKGIGDKTLAKMLPSIVPFGAAGGSLPLTGLASDGSTPLASGLLSAPEDAPEPVPAKAPAIPKTALTNVVNLNTAGAEELCTLPGIGPAKAQAILDFRAQHGPFAAVDDLLQVKGIGPKTLDKLRARLSV